MQIMKKINIFTLLMSILVMVGCDYNDKHFDGYDNVPITDVVQYEGVFVGDYPEEGYFTDRSNLQTAVNKMLKDTFLYNDKGSTAKIKVLFGDITPGFSTSDISYTLVAADYDSMGEESGQPGQHNNFDENMDVDGYLIDFITKKYADQDLGKVVSITYEMYKGTPSTTQTRSYKKEINGWHKTELNTFTADISYELVTDDYKSMGTEKGQPGEYGNFSSSMDINMYLSTFLKVKYTYMAAGKTANIAYKYYSGATTTQSRYYKYDGVNWTYFNPYGETTEVSTKTAEMEYDGSSWILKRLLGGSHKQLLVRADYTMLLNWVKVNKPQYMSTQNDYEEYYFGSAVAATYNNINNNYNTWKGYYNVNGEYDGLSNDQLQLIMDKRLAEGIATILLPELINNPDPGLSYEVTYNVYQGRGTGNYMQAFMYNEEEGKYELVSTIPVKQ